MAGRVVVSTLNNDTGVLATQNGMTGIAKAWVNYKATATVSIRDSFNVSSVTIVSTGIFTINFTTAMPNANYAVVYCGGDPAVSSTVSVGYTRASTTSGVTFSTYNLSGSLFDSPLTALTVFSS